MLRFIYIISLLLFLTGNARSQGVWMHPNAGQWDDRIEYKIEMELGELLIEDHGFTYHLTDAKQKMHSNHGHEEGHNHSELEHADQDEILSHVIKTDFVGSSWGGEQSKGQPSSFYRNYILGNDKSKWKSKLYSYDQIRMHDYYPGIDLVLDTRKGYLKYSLEVAPQQDANQIKIAFEGQDKLFIDEKGNLHITNTFGEIIEESPEAWLKESGANVKVKFKLIEDQLVFEFPNGYDTTETLVIDPPVLVFSTFTGSVADNWGMTATPDSQGNLAAGGIIFGSLGYPTTAGAFSSSTSNGTGTALVDLGITKFTADGGALVYSTFIGGVGSETPHSIVSSATDELFIFGATSSSNFPMSGTPYDNTYNGGPSFATAVTNGVNFTAGADIYVARLSADGTTLIASTFVGGSGADGLNISSLQYNYGDEFRGEIILDNAGNVYVSSTTSSTDFPIVQGAQGSLSGSQDAVVFKMPTSLSTLTWSTYFGGTNVETGNSVQLASNGDVFIAGGTMSTNMPFVVGHDLSFGGASDGYLARFNGNTGANLSGTYIGLNEYDQSYFVQLDLDDNVYVYGQTESDLGITTGLYGNPNSGQYVQKFNQALTNLEWKTMIGAGTGHVEISPTAFLVSDCYDIYLSGWGGQLNAAGSAQYSSTNGLPVTANAWQSTTPGDNFYIMVLGQNASILKYATFFGGTNTVSQRHVDGGTSRFDKSGRIYHAVCGGCGGESGGFTTTPGAWSQLNGSTNCNMAAFKFELSTIEALVTTPTSIICLPNPAIFDNNSANGNTFFWDFGDGDTSTVVNPQHMYPGPGTYTVTLVVSDSNQCYTPDSVEFVVEIGDFGGGIQPISNPICPGGSIQLEAFGGVNYLWSPAQFLDDPTIATPTATLNQTEDFMVIISDSCGIDTAYITVPVFQGTSSISNDTTICVGNSVNLFVTGGVSYEWTPANYLDDPFSGTPVCTPLSDIEYYVEVITADGCVLNDTVVVNVEFDPPIPVMPDLIEVCENSSVDIVVSGADSYFWYPDLNITATNTNAVTITPTSDITYYCDFSNACASVTDSVVIDVVLATIVAGTDTIICPGETATLWAQGGISYLWSPSNSLSHTITSQVYATPTGPTMYYVTGTDVNGCTDTDSVFVDHYPIPFIQTNPDVYAYLGEPVQLSATSTTIGPYEWYPTEFLSCVNCANPVATPDQNYTYFVMYTDGNGCSAIDSVTIHYDPIIYVPNTFTPGSEDEVNNLFKAEGGNIRSFEMLIFNRWGELIHTLNEISESWDGTYEGNDCQDGTYIWKATIVDLEGEESILTGHLNLLR
jgi:gliding motility-associated-like protein